MAATDTSRQVRAQAKWVRVSPRKAQVVAKNIRGRTVPEARTVLAFTQRAAAREIEKVLHSAVANAGANHGLLNDDELVVAAAYVDEGPTIKRWRPRARGRVARIRKRTCHITVLLAPMAGAADGRRRARRAAAAPTTAVAEPATTAETVAETETTEKPKRSARRKKSEETSE